MGYLAVLEQLSLAWVVENELGYDGCYSEYSTRLVEAINRNTTAVSKGKSATDRMQTVWGLGQEKKSNCYGVTRSEFQRSLDADDVYARSMEGAMVFMLFHEIAHHVLGHVDMYNDSMTHAQNRKLETEADIWSYSKSLSIRVNPIAGLPSWVFFSSVEGNDLEGELVSTHPLNVRRFKNMLEVVMKSNKSGEYEQTFGRRLDNSSIEEIARMIEEAEDML